VGHGVKSFLLTNALLLLILLHGQTIKNPVSGSVLPRHLPGKRAKGDILRRAGPQSLSGKAFSLLRHL